MFIKVSMSYHIMPLTKTMMLVDKKGYFIPDIY